MSSHPFVLIVEENDGHRLLIEEQLKAGFPLAHIECTHSFGEALKRLPQKKWDLLILNAKLADGSGIDFLDEITEHHPFAAVAILTDDPQNHVVPAQSHHRGSVEFLIKDRHTLEAFIARVHRLVTSSQRIEKLLQDHQKNTSASIFLDPQTQVYNDAYFQESLRREVLLANRDHHEFSVLIVDLDQPTPSRLKKLAPLLKKSVRASDIVARYGETKFSILLSKCHRSDAVGCARRVLGKIKQEASGLVIAMGVLHYQGVSKIVRPQRILTLAEKALAQAKKEERTHYVLAA